MTKAERVLCFVPLCLFGSGMFLGHRVFERKIRQQVDIVTTNFASSAKGFVCLNDLLRPGDRSLEEWGRTSFVQRDDFTRYASQRGPWRETRASFCGRIYELEPWMRLQGRVKQLQGG